MTTVTIRENTIGISADVVTIDAATTVVSVALPIAESTVVEALASQSLASSGAYLTLEQAQALFVPLSADVVTVPDLIGAAQLPD
jgi:hypothetical protein